MLIKPWIVDYCLFDHDQKSRYCLCISRDILGIKKIAIIFCLLLRSKSKQTKRYFLSVFKISIKKVADTKI